MYSRYQESRGESWAKKGNMKQEKEKLLIQKHSSVPRSLITLARAKRDYSSIAFDFAYMKKPLIYYQFDQDKYYTNHFAKGYFDCERDGFGPQMSE